MSEELRDQIAQTIDPKAFAFRGKAHLWPDATLRWKAALAKADSILALIDHLEADGGVEAMREACAKAAEDRFEYVRKGVPDSDFLEAARLIAEDIRALPVLGVGR